MKITKKITICIPCYNSEKYIATTIQSILASTYKNFEIHIIDNASTDNTIQIIKSIQKQNKNIFLHRNKVNIGMFPNMNKCIKIANGKYIKIICSDDILYPNCLEEEVRILDKHKDVVLVYGASNIITDKNNVLFTRKFFNRDRKINGGVLINQILLSGRNPLGEPTGILLRTSILKKYKLHFDANFKYVSDLELWIQMLQHGNGYYCNLIQSGFRLHKNQGTYHLYRRAVDEHIMLFSKYSEEFGLRLINHLIIYIKLLIHYYEKIIVLFFLLKKYED